MNLVIVESPTKAKTISKFLPREYKVESSFGHICDLPQKSLGVDVDKNYEPQYEVPEKAKKQVSKLKALAKGKDLIILATDEDREGEAISWHLKNILKPKNYQRITFHEITKPAIEDALKHPRELDLNLVDAQQARRVLDRLVGYKLSPFLWKKVAKGLSAGRVQSVAVRLVVEREREREAFKQDEFWTLDGIFSKENTDEKFNAKLCKKGAKKLDKLAIKNKEAADEILTALKESKYSVAKVESKESKKNPPPPFTTSTLQQAAINKFHFSAKQTMMLAQRLYEGINVGGETVGLITYMRTDSLNLSKEFLNKCQTFIKEKFGDKYASDKVKTYKTKSKGAQEAHEAIRPSDPYRDPESVKQFLDEKQYKLYKLIWSRTVACQMPAAVIDATVVDIETADKKFTFRANGQTVKFDGFMKVYPTSLTENLLPALIAGDAVTAHEIKPEQHFTQPPARYTEATLVKVMEEYGIGRPSTYAPTLATIQDRGYVTKVERYLKPEEMGMLVNDILVEHFKDIVDYKFTADMEKNLDMIAEGEKEWRPVIKNFYEPFIKNLTEKTKSLTKEGLTETTTDKKCKKCGAPMVLKVGRFGKFYACSNYPECKTTEPHESEKDAGEPAAVIDEKCPDCGSPLVEKRGRFGKFIGCSKYPDCKYIKKKNYGTGIKCPKCGDGEVVSRRSKRGKIFFGCNKYPKCDFVSWEKPNPDGSIPAKKASNKKTDE
jgi:DNA topoisomerase I